MKPQRNVLAIPFIRFLLWINWEVDWLMPFELNQFPRSLNLLWRVARDGPRYYPEAFLPAWREWNDHVNPSPEVPGNIQVFRYFVSRLELQQMAAGTHPSSSAWRIVTDLVETARKGDQILFASQLNNLGIPTDDPRGLEFAQELMEWLASFLPLGKPIIRTSPYWGAIKATMFFPNGSQCHLGTFSRRDKRVAEDTVQSYRDLLDKAPKGYFYGEDHALNGNVQLFVLTPTGWKKGVLRESDKSHEADWVSNNPRKR